MKTLVKYTCFLFLSFLFTLLISTNSINASSEYIYYDNGDEVTLNVEENNINTYGDFITYISQLNNIPESKIEVMKYNSDIGWNPASFYNTFNGDSTPFLEFLPSETCAIYFNYKVTLVFNNETISIYSEGHRLPSLSSIKKEGYKFKGWYTLEDEKYTKVDIDEKYLLNDITLYAKYEKEKDYNTWIIIGCVSFITISSIVTYFIKKKEKDTEK